MQVRIIRDKSGGPTSARRGAPPAHIRQPADAVDKLVLPEQQGVGAALEGEGVGQAGGTGLGVELPVQHARYVGMHLKGEEEGDRQGGQGWGVKLPVQQGVGAHLVTGGRRVWGGTQGGEGREPETVSAEGS